MIIAFIRIYIVIYLYIQYTLDTIPTPKQDFLSQPTPQIITNKKLRIYLHRLASVEQRVRSIQAKLYICNEDIRKYYETEGTWDYNNCLFLVQFLVII